MTEKSWCLVTESLWKNLKTPNRSILKVRRVVNKIILVNDRWKRNIFWWFAMCGSSSLAEFSPHKQCRLSLSLSIETELGTCSFHTVEIQGQWRCHCCSSCKYIVVYTQKTQSLAPFYTTESVNSRGEGLSFSLPFQVLRLFTKMLVDHWDMFWKNSFCCSEQMKRVCGAARLMKCLSVFKPHKLEVQIHFLKNCTKWTQGLLITALQHSVLSMQRVRGSCNILPISFQSSRQIKRAWWEGKTLTDKESERKRESCVGGEWRCHLSLFPGREVTPLITSAARWHICCRKARTLWCFLDTHCPLAFRKYIYLTYPLDIFYPIKLKKKKKKKLENTETC